MGEVKQNIDHELQDEGQFVVDDVSKIIKDAIENVIGGNGYNQSKVGKRGQRSMDGFSTRAHFFLIVR